MRKVVLIGLLSAAVVVLGYPVRSVIGARNSILVESEEGTLPYRKVSERTQSL